MKDKAVVKAPKKYRNSPHLNRWTQGEQGRERFETKHLRAQDVQRTLDDEKRAKQHAQFDEQAKGVTMKYERPQFAVVGEGTKTANERYRKNYDLIDWSR